MPDVDPIDEQRHPLDPNEPLWNESYYLDWFNEDGTMGGYVRAGYVPPLGGVWYWACLVEQGQPLVTVIEHDVPMPRSNTSMELRHDGLWADHIVMEPLERFCCSLEAFAVALDDPAEVYHGGRGDRVPFGFELEWETDRAAYQWPPITPRYEIPCRVHGEILVGDRKIEVDGWGQRDHSWGAARDWWSMEWNWTAGRLEDGTRWHTAGAFTGLGDLGVGYVLPPGSSEFEQYGQVGVEAELGREGLIERARLTVGDLDLEITPELWSPVLLVDPAGRRDRFPRALASVTAADGRRGHAWVEWNQNQPA
jgi:hypothetical protein